MTGFVEVLPPERTGPDHPEWFAERAKGITASEIAAVLGLSPWQSPFGLYWAKRGVMPDQADTDAMRWGRRLETYLLQEFQERHRGEFVICGAGLVAHQERSWQLASPDALVRETQVSGGSILAAVEAKTAGSWDGWGQEGTDQIPIHDRAQCLWQADVLGVDCVYVPVAVGRAYREYVVTVDDDAHADLEFMRSAAYLFLARVHDGDPPDVDAADATLHTLKTLHPDVEDREQTVPAGLAKRYLAACRAAKRAEDRRRDAENRLRLRLGTARYAVTSDGKRVATRAVYDRKPYEVGPSHIDSLRPAKEQP